MAKFRERFNEAKAEEEARKQGQGNGEAGSFQKEYRTMLDQTSPTTKIFSFILWGGVILLLLWFFT